MNDDQWEAIAKITGDPLAFYSQSLKAGDLVFDVGANVGKYTQVFVALGCRVVAIEPQSACIDALERIDSPLVTIEPVAVSDYFGSTVLRRPKGNAVTGIASVSDSWIRTMQQTDVFGPLKWDEKEDVNVTTLDVLVEKYGVPDYVKIDVEGSEYAVVKGLSASVGLVSFEFHPLYSDIEQVVGCLGDVQVNYSLAEQFSFAWDDWKDPGALRELRELDHRFVYGDIFARDALTATGSEHTLVSMVR